MVQRLNPVSATARFITMNVSSTAIGLSGVTDIDFEMNKWNTAWITVEVASVRYRYDSAVSPTTSVGHLLPINTPLQLTGRLKLKRVRFIGAAGAAAIINITLDYVSDAGGVI